jgi:cell division protease FtsH
MTAGASDDIERAAGLARKMVAELGMSDLGPICIKDPRTPHSQALLDKVEEAIRAMLDRELSRARRIVRERRAAIERLVDELLERDTLNAAEIQACFAETEKVEEAVA